MDILSRIQHDLSEGLSVIRKEGTSLFLKTMTEVDLVKYRLDIYKTHSRLSALYRELGEKFVEAVDKKDSPFFSRDDTKSLIEMIDGVKIEEDQCKKEIESLRVETARMEAFDLVMKDPMLSHPDHKLLRNAIERRWKDKLILS